MKILLKHPVVYGMGSIQKICLKFCQLNNFCPVLLDAEHLYTLPTWQSSLHFYLISLGWSGYSRWPEPWPMTVHGHQFSLRGRSLRTAPNCLTEILGCLRQLHLARTTVTNWTDYACSQAVTHPITNTVKCCLTSEI